MARPLDGRCDQTLELGGCASHATGKDLAAIGNEAAKSINVLVIDILSFDECEVANLAALKAAARATTITTHATVTAVTTIAAVSTAVAAITTTITAAGAGCAGGAATF
jgi:hypothetical protein